MRSGPVPEIDPVEPVQTVIGGNPDKPKRITGYVLGQIDGQTVGNRILINLEFFSAQIGEQLNNGEQNKSCGSQ